MKNIILACIIATFSLPAFAQENQILLNNNSATNDSLQSFLAQDEADTTKIGNWRMGGTFGLNLSQTYLRNWAGGGQNAISVSGLVNVFANYKKQKNEWENTLDLAYGVLTQGEFDNFFKTDDRIEFSSKYGRKLENEHLFVTALFNFRTQFAPGYEVTDGEVNEEVRISDFAAPAYSLLSLGLDYKPNDKFSFFASPVTIKTTLVLEDSLATKYGVDQGENIRFELGGYVKITYATDVVENVSWQTKLDLFSNYLEKPQNIDVTWENLISMKVNDFINVNITAQLIYDDDVTLKKNPAVLNEDGEVVTAAEEGPGVQFKETLAVGFSYKF